MIIDVFVILAVLCALVILVFLGIGLGLCLKKPKPNIDYEDINK